MNPFINRLEQWWSNGLGNEHIYLNVTFAFMSVIVRFPKDLTSFSMKANIVRKPAYAKAILKHV